METTTIFIGAIICLGIWAFLLVNIIQRAARSKEIEQLLESQSQQLANILEHLKKQTLLASNIAEKEGVSSDTISNILYPGQKKENVLA